MKREEDYIFDSGRKERQWLCRCDCGNEVIVFGQNLRKGNTSSCGCYRRENLINNKTKHGLSATKLWNVYSHMKSRCFNEQDKRYKNYGGRGISICESWLGNKGFEKFSEWAFSSGYNENSTIDRIDVDKWYEPQNCRWTDIVTQENNRTNNHLLTYKNKTMTMAMWAKEIGMNYKTLTNRILSCGWSVEDALTTPVRRKGENDYDYKR